MICFFPIFRRKKEIILYNTAASKDIQYITGNTIFSTIQDMPNETLLKILTYLCRKDLLRCSQVSKRLRAVSHTESLWQSICISEKIIPNEFLQLIIENGCKFLTFQDFKFLSF